MYIMRTLHQIQCTDAMYIIYTLYQVKIQVKYKIQVQRM